MNIHNSSDEERTPDGRIHEAIHERLAHGHFDASDVDIEVILGRVILAGSVESKAVRSLIAQLLSDIPGIQHLENRLIIKTQLQTYDALLPENERHHKPRSP